MISRELKSMRWQQLCEQEINKKNSFQKIMLGVFIFKNMPNKMTANPKFTVICLNNDPPPPAKTEQCFQVVDQTIQLMKVKI